MTKRQLKKKLSPIGKILYYTKTARFYHDGDGCGFLWRWCNPLTYIFLPVLVLISVLMYGILDTRMHELGLTINPYFKKNGIDPFSRKDD